MNIIKTTVSPTKLLDARKKCICEESNIDGILLDINEAEAKINNLYQQRAANAYKQRKLFTIYGNYVTIRKCLIRRGWIEKCPTGRLQKLEKLSYLQLLKKAEKGNRYETALLSKLVQSYPPNFIWQPKCFKNLYVQFNPFRNRVRRRGCLDFSTKVGLLGCFENSHWNTIENVAEITSMPSYKLSSKEDELYFQDYFRLTQSISILVYLTEYDKPNDLFHKKGAIPISVVEFPIKIIEQYYQKLKFDKMEIVKQNDIGQWENFNTNLKLIKENHKIIGSKMDCLNLLIKSQQAVEKAKTFTPFLFTYGHRNLWILKPGFQCRGQGIVIMDNLYDIINFVAKKPELNYVVQKYIERPLLIYRTKFDIRQFIILTVFDVISIWIYKDCYLRFSSKEFSLFDLGEEIHITNNSIQKKYTNNERDSRLPWHNMWSLNDFLTFLNDQGKGEIWWSKIYPRIKKNVISVVLSSLDGTDLTPNSFEIYGCDFMLDEHLDLFLIEINSTPDMSPSTPVTARICPSALEDLLKVVLDYSKNPAVSTGKFELIYQITCTQSCSNLSDLVVSGTTKNLHISKNINKNENKILKRKPKSEKQRIPSKKKTINHNIL